MADEIARLVAVMEAELKGFTKGMDAAQQIADRRFGQIEKRMQQTEKLFGSSFSNISSLASKFGITLSVAAVANFAKNLIETTANLDDQAKTLGISTDALQAYHAAAVLAGAGADVGDAAIQRFTRSIGDAAATNGPARKAFQELNLTADDLAGGPEKALPKVAAALAAIADVSKRAQLEVALFGKAGQSVDQLLKAWADPDLIQRMKTLGYVIDEDLIKQAQRATIAWDSFWLRFKANAASLLPMLDALNKVDQVSGGKVAGRLNVDPRFNAATALPFANATTQGIAAQSSAKSGAAALPWADPEAVAKAAKIEADIISHYQTVISHITDKAFAEYTDFLQRKQAAIDSADQREAEAAQGMADEIQRITDDADQRQAESRQKIADEIVQHYGEVAERMSDETYKQNVALNDKLRDAFDITGAAGIRAFDNIGDALKQMLQQIEVTIFQLGVMKPILDGLFGEKGSAGGGLLGGIIGSVLGFADGGSPPVGRASLVGERGPELFVPRVPGTIYPNGSGPGAAPIRIELAVQPSGEFNARVAGVSRRAAAEVVVQYDRALPRRVQQIAGDPWRT